MVSRSEHRAMTRMVWGRALAVWLLILLVETIHGVHGARWLVPFVWGFRARQAGAFTGSLSVDPNQSRLRRSARRLDSVWPAADGAHSVHRGGARPTEPTGGLNLLVRATHACQ